MSVYKRGDVWWYGFNFAGRVYQESTMPRANWMSSFLSSTAINNGE